MFLDFSIRTFKSPKIASELALPVSANSYTGVLNSYTGVCELVYRCRELVYRCLRTRIPVSMNSYTGVCEIVYCPYILWGNSSRGVYELVSRCLRTRIPVSWTRIPVSVNSYTGVLKLYTLIPVYDFTNTGIRVHRHRKREFWSSRDIFKF